MIIGGSNMTNENHSTRKRPLIFRGFKKLIKLFKKRPEIINLNDKLEDKAIYISNHSAANGPFTLSLFFPKVFVPWGIHYMCGNYKERWKYLYYVFYQQKLGYGKVKSFIVATIFATFSKVLYNRMKVIPTYTDLRLMKTLKISADTLNSNEAVLIFPENSDNGYFDVLSEFNAGFVALSMFYHKKYNYDLPVYPIYFSSKYKMLLIDKPQYIQEFVKKGYTREEIAEWFKKRTNELYMIIKEIYYKRKKRRKHKMMS